MATIAAPDEAELFIGFAQSNARLPNTFKKIQIHFHFSNLFTSIS
jgi:hypothetical protein